MQPDQIDLIRASFAKVLYKKDEAGRLFYDRLFSIAPDLRSLFRGDMDAQARKLMDTLAVAVNALRDPVALATTLRDLGQRHRGYGVRPAHYAKVGEALIWTLERGVGPSFDAPTRRAWVELYGAVVRMMEPGATAVAPVGAA